MEKLIVITTLTELDNLKQYIADKDYVAYDTETTGLTKEAKVIGFSIASETDSGFYVALSYWDVEKQQLIDFETKSKAKEFISLLIGKNLVMHNSVFDCWVTNNNFNIDLMPYVHTDTMILSHLLDENRHNGLKELGVSLFGEDAKKEQLEMKESVHKNGGVLTKQKYELYKADPLLLGKYGAKDALLTLKLFYHLVPELFDQGLDTFFYEEESMPLLRGPTYELNTTGLRIDSDKLNKLKGELEVECLEAKAFIHKEVQDYVKDKYPATGKTNCYNIGSSKQLAWLLFFKLNNEFHILTKEGKNLCKALKYKIPYSPAAKKEFIRFLESRKGEIYEESKFNPKTRKMQRPKKIGDPWNYIACGKDTLSRYSDKYKWVKRLLEYAKNLKLLNTYVIGIQNKLQYNIIRPSFLQHGTSSGRYSSRYPNFQNLPRGDKRVKACIISRPGMVFVGADYSQLEPRVFASFSKDKRLLDCFKNGDDFYSVIGMEVFEKFDCSLKKDEENSFAKKYPILRDTAKVVGLSSTYGTTAPKMAPTIKKTIEEAQDIIDSYFLKFPNVYKLMIESHEAVKKNGAVFNLFGRPRRIPKALSINSIYGKTTHDKLPYEVRTLLNLAINHRIQSTGASIVNRSSIAGYEQKQELCKDIRIVLQVHDEIILEVPEAFAEQAKALLKDCMENSVRLPGVDLIAEPKIANNLADLK